MKILLLCLVQVLAFSWCNVKAEDQEECVRAYLKQLSKNQSERENRMTLAEWEYETNITDESTNKQLQVSKEVAQETKEEWKEIKKINCKTFKDPNLLRQVHKLSTLGKAALPNEKLNKLDKVLADMNTIYSTSKICDYKDKNKCDLALEPEITTRLIKSRDPEELKHLWMEWRCKTAAAKTLFVEYVKLSNEAARLNNFTNNAEYWLETYETPNFKQQIEKLWKQLRPLYLQLHAYVRTKLRKRYGDCVSKTGPIPAHLLGNMWAQEWTNIMDLTIPFPEVSKIDTTAEMVKQGYTPEKIFKLAENFFVSLGLPKMTPSFWEKSILEKPNDGRELVCHASAWDFWDGEDFRIKQCTRINFQDLITAHHEMGHVIYYMMYKEQPVVYQAGANEGFHEAVGDVMSLSVSTTKHLKKIGLINPGVPDSENVDLNNLFKVGLDKIAFLPFGYLIDLWRWDVFEGKVFPDEYNSRWWKYRVDIQGVEPPVERTEANFDPAAKFHVLGDVSYIRYFVSHVIQFQFHRAACKISGEYDPNNPKKPLYKCDIYQSKEAGEAIGNMLKMGSSRPWRDAMEVLTGQRVMDASALLEYFKPLQDWLEAENKKSNACIGWKSN